MIRIKSVSESIVAPEYSYRDHSLFLTQRERYSKLFDLSISDYKNWAKGLKKAGYATDKKYPIVFIHGVGRYELFIYDDIVLKKRSIKNNNPTNKTPTLQYKFYFIFFIK